MAIAGFHGHDITVAMTPRLATVVTPRSKLVKSLQYVVARLQGNNDWVAKLDLGYEIEVGESI